MQKSAYVLRISDGSSNVSSSDLRCCQRLRGAGVLTLLVVFFVPALRTVFVVAGAADRTGRLITASSGGPLRRFCSLTSTARAATGSPQSGSSRLRRR